MKLPSGATGWNDAPAGGACHSVAAHGDSDEQFSTAQTEASNVSISVTNLSAGVLTIVQVLPPSTVWARKGLNNHPSVKDVKWMAAVLGHGSWPAGIVR